MYDYSKELEAFWDEKVRLSAVFKDKLRQHRKANRDRLIARLPDLIANVSISASSFKPQGSMAMRTIVQTRFAEEEYDIDDGLVLLRSELKDEYSNELSAMETKERVREALEDERFKRQPEIFTNCVRVFYAEEDEEKHHVDFPVYRKFKNDDDEDERELASNHLWITSDPTQVNRWFEEEINKRNKKKDGKGTQLRKLIQLLKRFSRSRQDWDLPNGMKLAMLASECQPSYSTRIDSAFRNLLDNLDARLQESKVILNLAHPHKPPITRSEADLNVCMLLEKTQEAQEKLEVLDEADCTKSDAREAWDWVFQSDGFFEEIDEDDDDNGDDSGSKSKRAGLITSIPRTPVDHRGGGRLG